MMCFFFLFMSRIRVGMDYLHYRLVVEIGCSRCNKEVIIGNLSYFSIASEKLNEKHYKRENWQNIDFRQKRLEFFGVPKGIVEA